MSTARLAWAKARTDLRMTFTSVKDILGMLVWILMLVAVAFGQWQHRGPLMLGAMGFMPASSAMLTMPSMIALEKTDGTILRRKNLPGGIQAYVAGRIIYSGAMSLVMVLVLLAVVLATGAAPPTGWANTAWAVLIAVVGGMALVPLGVAVGALLPNAREAIALISFPFMFLAAFSGVFTPTADFPAWLNDAARVFPLAWMVRGTQDAFSGHLDDFPLWAFALVCAAWLALGAVCAVPLMRTMIRKQTGSALAVRRAKSTA